MNTTKLRSPQEVARRVAVLGNLFFKTFDFNNESYVKFLKEKGLWKDASPAEKSFFSHSTPSENDIYLAAWRAEAAWVLLWALNQVPELGSPETRCDMTFLAKTILFINMSPDDFIENAVLRPVEEIVEAAHDIYHAHWAARDRDLRGVTKYGDLSTDVLDERHHAINWLICFNDDDWDNVITDT